MVWCMVSFSIPILYPCTLWYNGSMEEERKRCTKCGVEHPLHFFRKTRKKGMHDGVAYQYRLSICRACESKERIAKKQTNPPNPFIRKAGKTIVLHAKRMEITSKKFLLNFDLTVKYIATLFEREWKLHELGYTCLNCEHPHSPKLSDFTLDLIDSKRPPTRSNLRVICRTCNTEKGIKDPTEYDFECAEYRHNEDTIKKGVQFDLPEKTPITHSTPQLLLFKQ